MLKCRNRSKETEVRKTKYGSEKRSCLLVFSALLTHEYVCWGLVDKTWLYPCNERARSEALGLHWGLLSQIMHVTARPNQDKWWVGQPCGLYPPRFSWQQRRCECCHSSPPKAQPVTKLLHWLANSHHNLTLESDVSMIAIPNALLRESHSLPTRYIQSRVSKAQDTDRQLLFSVSYFGFCTWVSILQCFPLTKWHALVFTWQCSSAQNKNH